VGAGAVAPAGTVGAASLGAPGHGGRSGPSGASGDVYELVGEGYLGAWRDDRGEEHSIRIAFIDWRDPARNDWLAANQVWIAGDLHTRRVDLVLFVNGIPLVIAEYKSYLTSGKDWTEAVHQLHRYQRQAPLMMAPNVFCIAADEDALRYGTVLFQGAAKDDIDRRPDPAPGSSVPVARPLGRRGRSGRRLSS